MSEYTAHHLKIDKSPVELASEIKQRLAGLSNSQMKLGLDSALETVYICGRDDSTGIAATLTSIGTLASVSLPLDEESDGTEVIADSLGKLVTVLLRVQQSAVELSVSELSRFRTQSGAVSYE